MNTSLIVGSKDSILPSMLRDLTAVAVARLNPNGIVIENNQGFSKLTGHQQNDISRINVRDKFVNPSFSDLLKSHVGEEDQVLFQGIMTLGDLQTNNRSVYGIVYLKASELWFVAEHDIDDLERLNATVIELNNELSQSHRDLVKVNQALNRKEAEITRLMLTDTLTGMANRRHFENEIERELSRSTRMSNTFSLAICDIDQFKTINDTYGHNIGDIVLTRIAECISETVRKDDFTARWGGEEFVILFPDSDSSEAEITAERVRISVSELCFENISQSITISIGITQKLAEDTLIEIFRRADQALYSSKETGRNRVTIK